MKKEKILEWIANSISNLNAECDRNETEYHEGNNPGWVSKENGSLFDTIESWWGYQSLISQLKNIKKLIDKGEFDE